MEPNTHPIEALFEKTQSYTQTTLELYKLKAVDQLAELISTLTAWFVIFVFVALFSLILNIGAALWLGELLGKTSWGFFISAGFYAFIGAVLFIFRNKWIKNPLRNSIILQSLN